MHGSIPDFAEARRLFSLYRYQRRTEKSPQSDLIAEAEKRLEQVEWIVQRVARLQFKRDRVSSLREKPGTSPKSFEKHYRRKMAIEHALGNEIQLISESFYYFSWRLRQVLVNMPEFKKFNPRGVRDVRFHLLDHPEKESEALNLNFMFGSDLPTGPILKPFGNRKRDVHDKGLYANAQDFLDELLPRLRRAVRDAKVP